MALSVSVMGIVNVTPDSFFPASRTLVTDDALTRGRALFDAGCDVVDVGGESTRPGATPVDEAEEIARVVPVVEALARHGVVSIDTQKAAVARRCVEAGASIVNDVSCTLIDVAGSLGVGYVAMHRQGDSMTMQLDPHYDDVLGEVLDHLAAAARRARDAGVSGLWLDPGIGFGKTAEHNWSLLRRTDDFAELADSLGARLLVGSSRKRFLGLLGGRELPAAQRLDASLATATVAMAAGAALVRVHDVAATVRAAGLVSAVLVAS